MKSPQGWAIGRVIREGRLQRGEGGITLVEATIEMEDATKFDRGDYHDRVNICTTREDELAIVTLLKPGARVRVEGDIDATVHQDRFGRRIYTRVRITGSITLLEEAPR